MSTPRTFADPPEPVSVCFVCLGNICRSPTAEVVFREKVRAAGLEHAVRISSAGTGGWHVGGPADRRAVAALAGRGYDGSRHRARQIGPSWFADQDLVVAMDQDNARDLRALAPDAHAAAKVVLLRSFDPVAVAAGDLEVPDPYYGGPSGFTDVIDMVERACEGLIAHVRGRLAG